MGDHAEMRLDGTLCEGCGEYLGEGEGFVRYCGSCKGPQSDPPGFDQPLAKKPLGWLMQLSRERTEIDRHRGGAHPGLPGSMAPAQFEKLIRRGFAENWIPENRVHEDKVIITEAGKRFLENLELANG